MKVDRIEIEQEVTGWSAAELLTNIQRAAEAHPPRGYTLESTHRFGSVQFTPERNYGPTAYQGHDNIHPAFYSQTVVFTYAKAATS